jgi:hypothetical protein
MNRVTMRSRMPIHTYRMVCESLPEPVSPEESRMLAAAAARIELDTGGIPLQQVDRLRDAAQDFMLTVGSGEAELRAALRDAALHARAGAVQSEQFLVLVKALWQNIPDVAAVANEERELFLRQWLVTLAIGEYYRK